MIIDTEHYPHPCSWPRGQGHELRNFMLKFCVKVFKIWSTSASSGELSLTDLVVVFLLLLFFLCVFFFFFFSSSSFFPFIIFIDIYKVCLHCMQYDQSMHISLGYTCCIFRLFFFFFTRETFLTLCLLSCTPSIFRKGIYCKRKEFAPCGANVFLLK